MITGAGDGIGKAAALSGAAHGATVVLLGRTLSKLEAVYDAIEAAGGKQPAIFPINFDSATEQDYTQLYSVLKEEFGRVDGVLHNASELGQLGPVENIRLADWERVLRVNATAPFMMTKALMPLLKLSSDARIVFTTSGVGDQGRAYWGAYAASKGAVENFMQTLADELEETSVRVNAINPGAIRTNMRALAMPAEDPSTLPSPDTIMKAYVFLLGPASKKINKKIIQAQQK